MLEDDEQNLFGGSTCNYVTSHLWYQISFCKEFSFSFSCCSYRISDEYASGFIVKHIYFHLSCIHSYKKHLLGNDKEFWTV